MQATTVPAMESNQTMVKPNRQLVRKANSSALEPDEEFGMLLAQKPGKREGKGSTARSRLVLHGSLFTIGLISSIGCLWAMLYTSRSEEVALNLGLHRVANSLENILSLLAYPVLMFTVILTLYAAQQLYRLYKEVSQVTSPHRRRMK